MDAVLNIAVPNRVVERTPASTTDSSAASTTSVDCSLSKNSNSQYCQKPVSSSTFTLPIALGIIIPLVGAIILFVYLQRRHNRKQREEDANDPTAALDFGMGNVKRDAKAKGLPPIVPITDLDYREKGGQRQRQVSLDLTNVDSPYLLPPELHNSRESLHSLARAGEKEDPYRPVSYYIADGASTRSYSKNGRDGSSIYTGSSGPSRLQDMSRAELLSNAVPMSRSPVPFAADFVPPPRQNSLPKKTESVASPVDSIGSIPPPYPVEPAAVHLSEPVLRKELPAQPPTSLRPGLSSASPPSPARSPLSSPIEHESAGLGDDYLGAASKAFSASPAPAFTPAPASPPSKRKSPPPMINTQPAISVPAHEESRAGSHLSMDETSDYGDGFKITPPSPSQEHVRQRYSMDVPPEEFAQAGLGAPGFDPRRISLGFRPLPPDALVESEDPEMRANRIRSFYKEYFDDSKPAPKGQYYEDYDQNYLGDAAYFDADNKNFVMPYAEPVTRRAMTPPPRGPRFQGPPRPRNGSMGAQFPPGPYPPGPYPQGGPKAYSTASGARGQPRRPMPPPAALNTLPTPGKLGDDSFAIMGAMEFAPPTSYRERVQGRCDSPVGERRPYSPMVPSHTPLASAFDELAAMPSPHLLRKSGTFTGLDFAPPRKFRDPDTMSDSGSIRSNRSGISTTQLHAIRSGAHRVSRLPQDMVSTKDDMAAQLKPQWGMRPGLS
ncbi:hypothetical protein BP5796_11112 [Coleophoma crateriformis]|uniref:Uncharacterized protein n=1 Tax=Coleophoma crateriformis TaxID=565419 RepID=A0A3D8QME0_9HELO|nr:hypothetical protein BP5796_11112 [Coleophoma crateriformis]